MAKEDGVTWTVSELTQVIKSELERSHPRVRVEGEISNCKLHGSGHLYFTLKDAKAQIQAVMFREKCRSLLFVPKDGDRVIAEGAIQVYPLGGRYQIVARSLQKQGYGELLLKLEELKRILLGRGWFRQERKKKLPFFPTTIGAITSPTGAVIQDIVNILRRRGGRFHLVLYPVRVQGEGAAEEIARAIEYFNRSLPVDLLFVGRGGGSFEDLWCFNEERVAEAIVHSRIPILCAVGHESDHSIAEYVADLRAPTPSAAAELLMPDRTLLKGQLGRLWQQIVQRMKGLLGQRGSSLRSISQSSPLRDSSVLFGPRWQRLDELSALATSGIQGQLQRCRLRLAVYRNMVAMRSPQGELLTVRRKLDEGRERLQRDGKKFLQQMGRKVFYLGQRQEQGLLALAVAIANRRSLVAKMREQLEAGKPDRLLERGYSILFEEKTQSVINQASCLSPGDKIYVRLAKGTVFATVDRVESTR